MAPTPLDQYDQVGRPVLLEKLSKFVDRGKEIPFVMLGFPFKSTNLRDKVIGQTPDLAEKVTLDNFSAFNADIKAVYKPGVNISIASDGFIFNDLLKVDDGTVYDYQSITACLAKRTGAPMKFYNISDFYHTDLNTARESVVAQFALSPEKLEQEILINPDVNFLYRGMTHFMMEELADKGYPSKNQVQKAAKKLTRQMMIRNEAWSNLVKHEFKDHIRLSMHPSVNNGDKYSFKLIKGEHANYSAWHCAIYVNGTEYVTIHKKDAEAQGLQLEYKDGRPYNFINK